MITKNMGKIGLMAIIMIILLVGTLDVVNAQLPPAPTTPGSIPTPPPSGGGGGGGGGGGYTPPQDVYPKIIPVKNSSGIVIGNVTANSAYDIRLLVVQNITVNGQELSLQIEAKLNSLPSDPKLDIIGEVPDSSKLPSALTVGGILAQINLTRFSSGWNIQAGSLKLTLKLPKALAVNADLNKSMLVRYDGTSYELLYPSGEGPDANGTITFTVISPNEAFKYNGFSVYMLATSILPTPTPTLVPTASPTPGPEGGLDPLTVLLVLILVVLVAGAFIMYFLMQRRQ